MTKENEQLLTVSGWNIARNIASRYQAAFPSILPRTYNSSQFFFRHTDRSRTLATVRAFADGLFGQGAYRKVDITGPTYPDLLLRPHDHCPFYDEVSVTTYERDRWQNSGEFRNSMSNINTRLGLSGSQQLSDEEILTMWSICTFHQLWDLTRDAPYCGAFNPTDNLRLEYFEDLDSYYTSGYGVNPVRLAANLNCPIMQDMLNFIASDSSSGETVRVFSTHRTPTELFLVSLGVFQDALPLTADNFLIQHNRQWITSRLGPMASNISVVKFNCTSGDNEVLFLMNEKPLVIPGCQSNGLCKVSYILETYKRFIGADCELLSCSAN